MNRIRRLASAGIIAIAVPLASSLRGRN